MECTISQPSPAFVLVSLSGKIDEDATISLQKLIADIPAQTVTKFSFAHVTLINSLGVRAWVQFMRVFSDNHPTFFCHCPPEVVMQINMIPSFLSKAQVESFFTNYSCEKSQETKQILYHVAELNCQIPQAPRCHNCSCGDGMETEDLEDEYFAFIFKQATTRP